MYLSIVAPRNNEVSNNWLKVNFFTLLTVLTKHHNTLVANYAQGLHVTHDTGWFARDGGILTPDPHAAAPPLRLATLPPPPHNPLIRRTAHTPNSQTEVHTRAHFTITLDCMFICVWTLPFYTPMLIAGKLIWLVFHTLLHWQYPELVSSAIID